jgi:hypothetical protein
MNVNVHIEVHSRDHQVEHYVCLNCIDVQEAIDRIIQFYREREQKIGLWSREADRNDLELHYLIFRIEELKSEPVLYIAGEYRSPFPL